MLDAMRDLERNDFFGPVENYPGLNKEYFRNGEIRVVPSLSISLPLVENTTLSLNATLSN